MTDTCERCGARGRAMTMSKFNTEMICTRGDNNCKQREREHPKYAEADKAECEAVRRGETNFPGIGKPSDL